MTYTELLNQTIEQSGLSANEICRQCQAGDVDLKPTYLSELRNDQTRRASDKISRAIAKVCGKPEDWLVTQARLDSKSEMERVMYKRLRQCIEMVIGMVCSGLGYAEFEEEALQFFDTLPDVEILSEISKIKMKPGHDMIESVMTDSELVESMRGIDVLDEIPVEDDSMAPRIPKHAKVAVKKCEYKDGDILCYRNLRSKTNYIRKVKFLDSDSSKFMMIPYNCEYEPEIVVTEDILIWGKVTRLIVDLD